MNILIIGGSGFIGRHLVPVFAENGHRVTLFHRTRSPGKLHENIIEISGDRADILQFRNYFRSLRPDIAIDTIAYTPQDIWSLQLALKDVVSTLLVLSSGDVYNVYDTFHRNLPHVDNSPLTETSPLRSILFPYKPDRVENYDSLLFNYDKIIVEKLIQREWFNTVTVRLPAVFGPMDRQEKLSEYIRPMIHGRPYIRLSKVRANWIWTRTYVENAAYAIYLAATSDAAKNETFNLGDMNMNEISLINRIRELTEWAGDVIIDDKSEDLFNYSQNLQMNDTKIRHFLNYRAPISDEEALLKTINYYLTSDKKQGI